MACSSHVPVSVALYGTARSYGEQRSDFKTETVCYIIETARDIKWLTTKCKWSLFKCSLFYK